MRREKTLLRVVFWNLFILLLIPRIGEAFDDEAHRALSRRATQVSNLDNFLKTTLGSEFPGGINQPIDGKRVPVLIEEGAVREDYLALWRVRNHFHNPNLTWEQAGLRPPPLPSPIGDSSAVWVQNPNQGDGGRRSWHQGREAYFTALTARPQSERNRWYAVTFRLLGHAIHLVQDAAASSHTRNDGHLNYRGVGNVDSFHMWAELPSSLALINSITVPPFNLSFLNQPSPDSRYPLPIPRLFDTTAGDIGAPALGNGDGIGIAEYSNANFFSDDTIFPETFPFPGLSNLEPRSEIDPITAKKKTYQYFKPGFGETNYRLAQGSSLRNIVGTSVPTDIGLDNKVLEDYGRKLFPRAISYSAGLIDYFFRGQMGHNTEHSEPFPASNPPTTISFPSVRNETPGEQAGAGNLLLVLIYLSHTGTGTFPQYIVSSPSSVTLTDDDQRVTFSFSSLPFPVTLGTAYYDGLLVYRGPLGSEGDSVIASLCESLYFDHARMPSGDEVVRVGPTEGLCGPF